MNKNYPNYQLTQAQVTSLERLADRYCHAVSDLMSVAYPEVGNPSTACVMVPIGLDLENPTITIGIERDGYAHS